MIFLADDGDLFFPALADVETPDDAIAYLQILGDSTSLDHKLGNNADFDWLQSDGGMSILSGFGSYAILGGDEAYVASTSDAIIFQKSAALDLEITGGETELIFDPNAKQTISIKLAGGGVTLHASTSEIFSLNTLIEGTTKIIDAGETTIFVEGDGPLSFTDLANDALLNLSFETLEPEAELTTDVAKNADITPSPEGHSTDAVREPAEVEPTIDETITAPDSLGAVTDATYVTTDDFYLNYNTVQSAARLEADLSKFILESLDEADNVFSASYTNEAVDDSSRSFEGQVVDLQAKNDTFVAEITEFNEVSDLIFDDGADIYWGL